MTSLPPWTTGTFELLRHAEGHLRSGDDFDRRIALISFDNAIEVAIATYLTLNPILRGNRQYARADIEKWLSSYYTKLDFFATEMASRKLIWEVERSHIIWCHDHRNEQYHGGNKGTPEKYVLVLARKAALWIFGVLFGVPNVEELLEAAIASDAPLAPPQRDDEFDRAIDGEFAMVKIGRQTFYASEVLFSVDYTAYRETGARLCQPFRQSDAKDDEE
jgi:hypothetical protein